MKRGTMTINAGRLACGKVRNCFLMVRGEGHDIQMTEGGGFLARPFVFAGTEPALHRLHEYLEANFPMGRSHAD